MEFKTNQRLHRHSLAVHSFPSFATINLVRCGFYGQYFKTLFLYTRNALQYMRVFFHPNYYNKAGCVDFRISHNALVYTMLPLHLPEDCLDLLVECIDSVFCLYTKGDDEVVGSLSPVYSSGESSVQSSSDSCDEVLTHRFIIESQDPRYLSELLNRYQPIHWFEANVTLTRGSFVRRYIFLVYPTCIVAEPCDTGAATRILMMTADVAGDVYNHDLITSRFCDTDYFDGTRLIHTEFESWAHRLSQILE